MLLGGVEKELITVLKKIHNNYDITLIVLYLDDYEILQDIPKNVKIKILGIDPNYYYGSSIKLVKQRLKKGKIIEAFSIALKRMLNIGMTTSNIDINEIPSIEGDFDVAICYHIHSPLILRYVVEKIKARKKVAWIHSDFYTSGYPIQKLKKYVVLYDEFVSVSKKVEEEFRTLCPWYEGGISTAYNYLDENEIRELAKCPISDMHSEKQKVKILTVGRFSEEKGIDQAIYTAYLMKQVKKEFIWFLIGHGKLENYYRQLIEQYDVADCFTILGKKTNPYPYIKACDIYVQPSRHEAFGLVIKEAKILGKPIVCTDFDGADEQIENGVNGIIVPLNDTDALSKEIAKLVESPESRERLSKELEKWQPEDDLKEIIKHFE